MGIDPSARQPRMKIMRWLCAFVLAIGFAGCGGCFGPDVSGPAREIVSETMEKDGDTWKVQFVSTFDAPVDKVYEAFSKPEASKEFAPENVLKSELVKQEGNTKVVDIVGRLDILPPGFKVQNLRNEFVFYPDEKRFTQKTIDFPLADLSAEFKFAPTPDGKGTVLTFDQTSKTKSAMLVDSLQKGALRETYITQVRVVNKMLGLDQEKAAPTDTQG
jgi:ligand-binding SRPBCC domain-containing protein